jgi:hypothetical protein
MPVLVSAGPARSWRFVVQRHYPALIALIAVTAVFWSAAAGKLAWELVPFILGGVLGPDWRRSFRSPNPAVSSIREKVQAYHQAPKTTVGVLIPLVLSKKFVLMLVAAISAPACLYVGKHTSALRELQHQAVERCRRDSRACPQAHLCATATVKAGAAWALVAQTRKADAQSAARGGAPVNLMILREQEQAAQDLDVEARRVCPPGASEALRSDMGTAPVDMGVKVLPDMAVAAGPCRDNLCGGGPFGENHCSCHGAGDLSRCWGTVQRCEQDWACCSARGGCKGTTAGEDVCSSQVRALGTNDAGVAHGG